MTRLLLALAIAAVLSFVNVRWEVTLPPLPNVAPQLHAAGGGSDTECVLWADIKPWAITRCESWETGEVCMQSTSGMLVCKFE